MKKIAELIVRVADLVEAEGRSLTKAIRAEGRVLRESATRLGFAAVSLIGGSLLLGVGLIACLLALFLSLQQSLGTAGATAIVGGILICAGLLLIWLAKRTAE